MSGTLAPGSTFAGYRIEALVGRGGMGVVYRATDLSLERPVALKLIAPELAGDERFRARFLNEPRLAASLDHPNVVPIYEAGERDGHLYLAMRYVEGRDLRSILEAEGRLEPERALAILAQVAGALDAAHRRGLVHRDVKPANVLLDADEHVYLSDFGISTQAGGTAADSAGTLEYLAPEQIRGEPVDGRTDGYALGCVLHECLAGEPPFRRETQAETLWAHLHNEPPPLHAHPELDPVLRRALAKEQDERYPSCSALIDAARGALGLGVPAAPRGRRAIAATAALLLAAAIATAVLVLPAGEGEGEAVRAPTGNGVAAIDPAGGAIASFSRDETAPSNVAVGEGAVWVLNSQTRTVSRIEPATGAVTATVESRRVPTDLAAGGGALWIGTGAGPINFTTRVSRIDPQTLAITRTVKLAAGGRGGDILQLNSGFPQMAVGAGALWATGGGAVTRIDLRTGRRVARVDVDAARIAAGEEGVWVLGAYDTRTVTRIDPRTNRPTRPIRIGESSLSGIAVGAGSVWATAEQEGIVWRVDPGRSPLPTPIDVGSGVSYIAYGAGAVWAGNFRDGTVSRIDPRTNRVTAKVPMGAVQALAAGAGAAWVSTAGATAAGSLPASACGPLVSGPSTPDVVIASDLPLQGENGRDPRAMVAAIRSVLAQHGFRAGRLAVGYRSCDDSTGQSGWYEPRRCAANANAYAEAKQVVAVIGPYNSDCAGVEIPILNRAPGGPLAMISPSNSYTGLTRDTRPPQAGYRGEPDVYYPIGTRHYVRLSSPESLQGVAYAELARELGMKRVYLLDDGSGYWRTVLTEPFRKAAPRFGVGIAGAAAYDPDARSHAALIDRIVRSDADGVVLAAHPFDGELRLLKSLRARLGPSVPVMVGYGFASWSTAELFDVLGAGARGLYVATGDVPRTALPATPAARRFVRETGPDRPYALEAAQAAEVVLGAIARSDGTRASVLQQLRDSRVEDDLLGSFRFDRNGDMTPGWMPILRITEPVKDGRASELHGAEVVRVVRLPPSLGD